VTRRNRTRLVACVACTALAYVLEQVLALRLAARDPLAAAITGSAGSVLATALPLLAVRLFLFLGAPAWLVFAVGTALAHGDGEEKKAS
jgi:hypothetical protein